MSAVVDKVIRILTDSYSNSNYVDLMTEILEGMQIVAPNNPQREYTNYSSHIENYTHVGTYTSPDNKKIIVMSVELKNRTYVENSRSTQRSYAKKLIENANADGALIAFRTTGETRWRLSFVRLDYEIKVESGKLKAAENITPARRYSFLVGKDEPCHTAVERFRLFIDNHAMNPTLDELEKAFSVEAVTKEFFELYREKFLQLCECLEMNESFVSEAKLHNYTSAQFAKKLMGQIVFLYFLQKKGWLGVSAWPKTLSASEYKKAFFSRGSRSRELIPAVYAQADEKTYRINTSALNRLSNEEETFLSTCVKGEPWGSGPHNFMRRLFETSEKKGANFFEAFLEPLFYDALNVNRGEQGYDPALHCRIPFLSGGLFEPIDGYEWKHNNFGIPNELFSNRKDDKDRLADGILDIFDRYNFTMSEDEPLEREVAIDPEMLGKVFENLLDVNDRKSKGAFYTPREIVHYMCQESLINYLTSSLKVKETAIRDFILFGDFMKDEDASVLKRAEKGESYELWISEELYLLGDDGAIKIDRMADLDKALQDVRVADPAVGSGAFPLGMLNEIVRARQNVTTYMDITQKIRDPKGASLEIRYRRVNERSARQLKYDTIRNCIFAVDIEPSAVDITQLRLWLALVIDDEIDPNAISALDGHRNPLPLPNLECNILCGNSLIDDFGGIKLVNESELLGNTTHGNQIDVYQSAFDATLERLTAKQDELFRCDNTDKKAILLQEIADLRNSVIMTQLEGVNQDVLEKYEVTKQLASKPFVLWQLDFTKVFREKGGFDIVIGNPPYLAYKKIDMGTKNLYNKKYCCAIGQYDLYGLFIERGYQLLRSAGLMTYITSSTYFNNKDFKLLRKHLLVNSIIKYIVNLDETIFESAQLDVAIIGLVKTSHLADAEHRIAISKDKGSFLQRKYEYRKQLDFIKEEQSYEIRLNSSSEDVDLINKLSDGSEFLGSILDLPRGIEIGGNSLLISNHEEEGFERLLVGRNLKRYQIAFNNQYIKFDETDQSCFKDHDIYLQPKILIQRIRNLSLKQRIVATIDTENYICTNTLRIGILINNEYNLHYVLGIINSKLINWMFLKYFMNKDIYSYQLRQIPVKNITLDQQMKLAEKVIMILHYYEQGKVNMINATEKEIDDFVYQIYGLTEVEKEIIERTNS